MNPTGGSVAEFVAGVAPAKRRRDAETLLALMSEVSGREPRLWGTIIGFGRCHYRYPTGHEGDSPVIGFAPRKTASTLYLLDGVEAHADALARLGTHRAGVGCLYLPDLEKVDVDVLRGILGASKAYVDAGGGEYAAITVID